MDYQELYAKYQSAVKLRELSIDNNYKLLKEIFIQKIVSSISFSAQNNIILYLAGIKDVFNYVDSEIEKISSYRDELDRLFKEDRC
ncbi:MAG: hypothetical protein V2B14_01245 [bacterium]